MFAQHGLTFLLSGDIPVKQIENGNPEVDDAVRGVIDLGNMSTLYCPEEVYLAERLIEIHPWADMRKEFIRPHLYVLIRHVLKS